MRNKDLEKALRLERLSKAPPNLAEFVEEIGDGISRLFGRAAGESYRHVASGAFEASLQHPSVLVLSLICNSRAAGILTGISRGKTAEISQVHVLKRFAGKGWEQLLVKEAIDYFRQQQVEGIVCEFVPMCSLSLDDCLLEMGMQRVPRKLMLADADAPALRLSPRVPTPMLDSALRREAASCLFAAYREDPGRFLHAEVHKPASALDFIARVVAGSYGVHKPEYALCVKSKGRLAGVVLGCEIAGDTGFVLQLAVHPKYRRKGFGTALLRGLCRCFAEAGLKQVALGVTASNPACDMYAKMGFRTVREVDAYFWWAPQAVDALKVESRF